MEEPKPETQADASAQAQSPAPAPEQRRNGIGAWLMLAPLSIVNLLAIPLFLLIGIFAVSHCTAMYALIIPEDEALPALTNYVIALRWCFWLPAALLFATSLFIFAHKRLGCIAATLIFLISIAFNVILLIVIVYGLLSPFLNLVDKLGSAMA